MKKLLFVLVIVAFLISACGGDAKATATPEPTDTPSPTPQSLEGISYKGYQLLDKTNIEVVKEIDNFNGINPLQITFTDNLEVVTGGIFKYREKGSSNNWVQSPVASTGAHAIAWKKNQNGNDVFYVAGTHSGEIIRVDDISKEAVARIGARFYVHSRQVSETVPLYRYWNSSIGDHFYTTEKSAPSSWEYEGIQCYVYPRQVSETVPLYRFWNSFIGDHFYSTSSSIPNKYEPEGLLYRPHDILYNPNDDYFYFIHADYGSSRKYLYRFKDFDANSTLANFEKLDLSNILTNKGDKAYARSISLVDGKIYIINSSHGEVVRLDKVYDSFAAVDYTSFKSRNDERVAPAGAYELTGLILNDVDYYNGYWYGTNFFSDSEKYALGYDYNIYRLIRWKTWDDFEKGQIEDLSNLIDTYMVPYYITINDGLLYIAAFPAGGPPGENREAKIYVLSQGEDEHCNNVQGYHTVRRGETVYSIGRAYLTYPREIAICNYIVNPNLIYPDLRLAIPVAPWPVIPSGPVAQRQFTPGDGSLPDCRYMHTVKRGETLTWISLRYGVSVQAIAHANKSTNPSLIYARQMLCIP